MNDQVVTTKDLVVWFHVSEVTLWNWRNREVDPLPQLKLGSNVKTHIVMYDRDTVIEWAKRNNKSCNSL